MIDYRVIQILHPHGTERVEMHRQPHDAAEIDPERRWGKGAIVFKCSRCEEEIVVMPPVESPPRR